MTVERAGLKPGDGVLDVGCGTGELTLVAKAGVGPAGRAVGIDASPEMIEVARQKAARAGVAVDFRVDLVEKMPFADSSFDVVLSSLMMHHLPGDLKRQALVETRRVLKPGGRLFIVDIRRPVSRTSRVLMTLLLHGSMRAGVQDLPPLMRDAGFTDVAEGTIAFRVLGFVRGRAA
jgi:demethylmenaquinone methyltransferase/2-methoxy-6-polyprenyl-1,4-benzoquinol methylase/phosphoethanolamine N-methyltransferase